MSTKAEQMADIWVLGRKEGNPKHLARWIDPRVRIEDYLYTTRVKFIFSDGSKAEIVAGCFCINPAKRR